MMYSILPAVVAMQFIGYGLYVVRNRGLNAISATFFAVCLTTFFWQFTWAILFQVRDPQISLYLVKFGYLLILFLPTTLYHFLVEITGYRSERPYVYVSYGVAGVLAILLIGTDLFIAGYYDYFWGYYPKAGPLHPIHLAQTAIVVTRGLWITYQVQRTAPPRQRIQLRYCIVSLAIYFLAAVDYLCNYGFEFYPPGALFIAVSLGVIAIAVVKHQLMDIAVALSNGIAKMMVITAFALVYLGFYLVSVMLFPSINHYAIYAFTVLFLVIFAESYHPLRRYLQEIPNSILLKNRKNYPYRQVVNQLESILSHNTKLPELFLQLVDLLEREAHINPVTVFLRADVIGETHRWLDNRFLLWDTQKKRAVQTAPLAISNHLFKQIQNKPLLFIAEVDEDFKHVLFAYNAYAVVVARQGEEVACLLFLGRHEGSEHYTHDDLNLFDHITNRLGNILGQTISAYIKRRRELDRLNSKRATLLSVASSIAHEMRSPLATIALQARTISHCWPALLDGYQKAVENKLCQPQINVSHIGILGNKPNEIETVVNKSNRIIDMLLASADLETDNRDFAVHSIRAGIEEALLNYPREPGMENKMRANLDMDFDYYGSHRLLVLVLFNLLKNAYHAIKISGKGEIYISLIKGTTSNSVQFTDTASGIERNVLPYIFDDFFTTKPGGGGAGIGLAFCKRTINSFGGNIRCESIENAYTTFYLHFPDPINANLVGTAG